MKLTFDKDTVIEVCSDEVAIADVISSKINSVGREEKDDAFFVCDLGDVIAKYKKFNYCLPRVEPFYAIKCNNDPSVTKLLVKLGLGFDCASKAELQTVLSYGVSPRRIIYANPCKQASHLRFAASSNVSMMTFDNELELHKIKDIYPTAELVIRIKVDDSKAVNSLGIKYGASLSSVKPLLEKAKALGLNVIGVSFHVGSGCYDARAFYEAVRLAKIAFDEAEEVGYHLALLDVGGGFPGDNTAKISFEETADYLNKAFDEFFPLSSGVRIIAEPGRFFVSSAFTIACNIIAKRAVYSDPKSDCPDGFMYYVNDGVYGSFNCVLFDHMYPKAKPLDPPEGKKLYKSSVWGPTCDSMDCISKSEILPKMDIGDWLYFENMGAYTLAAASTFNGFSKSIVVYIIRSSLYGITADLFHRPSEHKRKTLFQEDAIANISLTKIEAVF